jgi:precorrin-6B methylase 2
MSSTPKRMYSDPEEDKLLALFESFPQSFIEENVTKLLDTQPSWPLLIHLSPQRQLLLNWFSFKKDASLLEIGAGGGSLTGMFLEHCKEVTAVELSPVRSEILRRRYRDKKHLTVVNKDIATFNPKAPYDYVTLIGVLEYAGAFFKGGSDEYTDESFIGLLQKCRSMLNEHGALVLAIENQWGLKYLTGCLEDHYNTMFESMNNYPTYNGTRTFGQQHLTDLLDSAGFNGKFEWYFPFPDYKFPHQVLSEEWLSQPNFSLSGMYPSPGGAQPRQHFFNEVLGADSLRKNNLLPAFANSFLVIAHAT